MFIDHLRVPRWGEEALETYESALHGAISLLTCPKVSMDACSTVAAAAIFALPSNAFTDSSGMKWPKVGRAVIQNCII